MASATNGQKPTGLVINSIAANGITYNGQTIWKNLVTLTFQSNNTSYGTVTPTTLSVPYGSEITINGATLTVGGQTVTATAANNYGFSSWSVADGTVVIEAMTIMATFVVVASWHDVWSGSLSVSVSAGSSTSFIQDADDYGDFDVSRPIRVTGYTQTSSSSTKTYFYNKELATTDVLLNNGTGLKVYGRKGYSLLRGRLTYTVTNNTTGTRLCYITKIQEFY
jgi:hypothetical protein